MLEFGPASSYVPGNLSAGVGGQSVPVEPSAASSVVDASPPAST
jgi:hypothetical protein